MYSVLEKVEDRHRARVEANVACSYAVIKKAAKPMQKDVRFKNDPSVSGLKFSNMWIKGFLTRNAFCRRKATATVKDRPPLAETRAIMTEIQEIIEEKKFSPAQCFSSDETGMFYASPPRNQYVALIQTSTRMVVSSWHPSSRCCWQHLEEGRGGASMRDASCCYRAASAPSQQHQLRRGSISSVARRSSSRRLQCPTTMIGLRGLLF